MEWFIGLILSWMIAGQPIDVFNTGYIQEQFIIENYFHRTEEMAPIVYRSGRILGKSTTESNYINRSDCSGIWVGYMRELGLTENRILKEDWKIFSLDSYWLYLLWTPKNKSEVKRWDFIFMVRPDWVKHFAVACDDSGEMIYDLYKDNELKCRHMTAPVMKYASNWIVEYLSWAWIVLDETKEVLNYFKTIKDEYKNTDNYMSDNSDNNLIDIFVKWIKTIIRV